MTMRFNLAVLAACLIIMILAIELAQAESEISIEFVAPMFSDESLTYPESPFSSPGSYIIFDSVVFGNPDNFVNKTVIQMRESDSKMAHQLLGIPVDQEIPPDVINDPTFKAMLDQLSGGRYAIRISGTVYDELANLVPNNFADIDSITLLGESHPEMTVPVNKIERAEYAKVEQNELIDLIKNYPEEYEYELPYPFVGRFQTEVVESQMLNGVSNHRLVVKNAANRTFGASIRVSNDGVKAGDNIPLHVELNNSDSEPGMTAPVFVFFNDDSVNAANIATTFATINGHKTGLKISGGRLQLNWPLVAIAHRPPGGAVNVVQVGNPEAIDHFIIEYKGLVKKFTWSYTR